MENSITRRRFVQWIGSAAATAAALPTHSLAQGKITALDVVGRIQSKLLSEGVPWSPSHFDGFHLGDPKTPLIGIATTFQPGLDVLQRAAAKKKNLVICHE